jgi:hypothetical protein
MNMRYKLIIAGAFGVTGAAAAGHQTSALAHGIVGAAANEGCCYRARQQIARMVWAMMARGERYKEPVALAG